MNTPVLVGKGSVNGGSIDLDFSDDALYASYTQALLTFLFGFSLLTLVASFFHTTPYGRFMKSAEKFTLPSLAGWYQANFSDYLAQRKTIISGIP